MMKYYTYYMTQRPPMPGAMPKEGLRRIVYINQDETPGFVEEISMEAYARLEYDHELTRQQVDDYELVPAEYEVKIPRSVVFWICEQLELREDDSPLSDKAANELYCYLQNIVG